MFLRILLIFLVPTSLFANDRAIVVYTEEFPPYNFTVDGNITGINIGLVKEACEAASVECVFEIFPWNRAMRMALEGPNTGLVSTARTNEREKLFKWVGPFLTGQNCIYKLADRTDIKINGIESVSNYVMGASTDSVYSEILTALGFEEGKNLKLYDGKYTKIRPFAANRVDLIIGSATSIQMQLSYANLELNDVVPVATIDTSAFEGNYLALHPAIDDEVIIKMQSAIDKQLISGSARNVELAFVKPVIMASPERVEESLWNACMKEKPSTLAQR